jgi:hypothetical protein
MIFIDMETGVSGAGFCVTALYTLNNFSSTQLGCLTSNFKVFLIPDFSGVKVGSSGFHSRTNSEASHKYLQYLK